MTQIEYLGILFTDCGYDTSAQRRAWLEKRFGRSFADELDSRQRSLAISFCVRIVCMDTPGKETLKEKMKNALRKTGHVTEEALDAVAEVAIETATGLGESEP